MNHITPTPQVIHCNKSYYQITRRLACAAVWVGLAFSPAAVLAADIIANPNIISTDRSGDNAYGVKTLNTNAENGVVDIQTGGKIDDAAGGYSDSGIADNNQVTVSGGTVNKSAAGGASINSNANNNQITVSAGMVTEDAAGGASTNGNANNNQATVTGGTVTKSAVGGASTNGNANNNQVTINDGTVDEYVAGGASNNSDANNNQTIVTGGMVNWSVFGGTTFNGNAQSNQVTMSGGTVNGNVEGGFSSSGNLDNNQVTINGGTVNGTVEGGFSGSGNLDNNQITINGGTVNGNVWGGFSGVNANNNQVTITGGTVNGTVLGGLAGGDANNNQVAITGGTFTDVIAAVRGLLTVEDNTLTISGGSFANSVDLYGYYTLGTPPATASGNSIHLKVAGLTINNIADVNNLYFYLPNNVQNGDSVAILQDAAAAGTDLSSTIIGVCSTTFGSLAVGDEITLIDAAGTLQTSSNNPANDTGGMTGCSTGYEFALEKVNNTLIAKVTKATAATYTIGGTVSGLSGTLVLQNNGGDDLTLTADGGFTFATAVADGANYAVSVLTQPAGQNCSIANASGTVNGGPVTDVSVTCQATSAPQQGAAQPVPGLGGKTLALLMLILAAITAWVIHRRLAIAL